MFLANFVEKFTRLLWVVLSVPVSLWKIVLNSVNSLIVILVRQLAKKGKHGSGPKDPKNEIYSKIRILNWMLKHQDLNITTLTSRLKMDILKILVENF